MERNNDTNLDLRNISLFGKYLKSIALMSAATVASLQANEEPEAMRQQSNFVVNGHFVSHTKYGFNNTPIGGGINNNESTMIATLYPTDTWSGLLGQLNGRYDFVGNSGKLSLGAGITVGGISYDSTSKDDFLGKKFMPGGLTYNYIGYWDGYDGRFPASIETLRGFTVHNLNVNFDSNYFKAVIGRFASTRDWFSGYAQGFQTSVHLPYGDTGSNPLNEVSLWGFGTYGRGLPYVTALYDFYRVIVHAIGVDFVYGGFDDNGVGSKILLAPALYSNYKISASPTLKVVYDNRFNLENGILLGSETTFHTVYSYYQPDQIGKIVYGQPITQGAYTFILNQQFSFGPHKVGLGAYKNIGNANSRIGTYGNPTVIDLWTGTLYEFGPGLVSTASADALSLYGYMGSTQETSIGTFSWKIQGRYTNSPRANDISTFLDLSNQFANHITIATRFHFFQVTTNSGFAVGYNGAKLTNKNFADKQDRSYVALTVTYAF